MKKLLFASILLALISSAFVSTNTRTITGTIKDQNGDPVPFATIVAKGTHQSVAADANANFKMTIDDKVKILEVSAVGMQTQEVQLTDASHYNVIVTRTVGTITDCV